MKVIFISGKARHGKDTTARILKSTLESDGFGVIIVHYGDLLKYICKTFFNWNGDKDESGRTLLQYVGTDVIRKQDENYWVRFVCEMLTFFNGKWDYVLIPDCRFPNEVSTMVDNGFDTVHIRVVRDGFKTSLTEEQQKHPSETALDDVVPDYYIHNDGTLDDLTRSINKLIKENLYGHK